MRDFNYELKELCRRKRDGSYATQANRERILDQMASLLASDFNGCFAAVNLKRLSSASCPIRPADIVIADRWFRHKAEVERLGKLPLNE